MQKQFAKENTLIVKGLAIILMLFYHIFENEYVVAAMGVNYSPFSLEGILKFSHFGNICVSIFVFLTAFGISTGLLAQEDLTAQRAYSQATKRFFHLMLHFFILYASVNLLWFYKFDYTATYGVGKQGVLQAFFDATGLFKFFDSATINTTWWYMKIAYILIFLIPLLAMGIKKIGYPIIILSFLATVLVPIDEEVERFLFTAVLGVCAAYGKWPDKLMNVKCPRMVQWIVGFLGFVICIFVRQNKEVQENYLNIVDGFVVVFIVYFAGVLLASVPVLKNVLRFIGKHSMNIYLVHTFFYMILWKDFIYSFKYGGLILLVLLIVSLLYSVVLELIKKLMIKIWNRIVLCMEPKAP